MVYMGGNYIMYHTFQEWEKKLAINNYTQVSLHELQGDNSKGTGLPKGS